MPSRNVFKELCVKITLLSPKKNSNGVCNAVYFRLCIDLMHITPTVKAEADGSHYPRYAELNLYFTLLYGHPSIYQVRIH